MNDYEIIEKKNYLTKVKDKDFDYSMSPEESKAVYLKKCDAANQSAGDLNNMSLTDDDGHVVASSVAEKKDLAAKEDEIVRLKKLGKLNAEGVEQEAQMLVPRVDQETGAIWFEPTDHYFDDKYELKTDDDVYQSDSRTFAQRLQDAGVVMGKHIAEMF